MKKQNYELFLEPTAFFAEKNFRNCSGLDVFIFVCALGEFLVLSASVLRQIACYLPHHTSENASKTHPKSSHDKFKTVSKKLRQSKIETTGSEAEQN